MRITILSLLMLMLVKGNAQKVDWKKIKAANADRVLLSGDRQPTKVLLLGTFHFAYPNQDAHKTDSSNFIDVLSSERQKELAELAEVIRRFKPTRVYLESSWHGFHDSLFAEYKKGKYQLGRNEIYQVGYRVAGLMNHEKIFCVDAGSYAGENYQRYPKIDSMWSEPGMDTVRDASWSRLYKQMYTSGDSLEKHFTMLENFLMMAEPITQRRMHGAYLTGGFNTASNSGPDILSMWWFSRNLRIFNNILKTKPGNEDRIVVLFGNGHAPILRHCFEASPEFELIELKSLLK